MRQGKTTMTQRDFIFRSQILKKLKNTYFFSFSKRKKHIRNVYIYFRITLRIIFFL